MLGTSRTAAEKGCLHAQVQEFEQLWPGCAVVADGGQLPAGREGSTIVDLSQAGSYRVCRAGSHERQTCAVLQQHGLSRAGPPEVEQRQV